MTVCPSQPLPLHPGYLCNATDTSSARSSFHTTTTSSPFVAPRTPREERSSILDKMTLVTPLTKMLGIRVYVRLTRVCLVAHH